MKKTIIAIAAAIAAILSITAVSVYIQIDRKGDAPVEKTDTPPVEKPVEKEIEPEEKPDEKSADLPGETPEPVKPEIDKGPKKIVSIDKAKVNSLTIRSGNEELLLDKADSLWSVNNGTAGRIDYEALNKALEEILNISTLKTVAVSGDPDSSQWGTENSGYRVVIKAEGISLSLLLGKAAPEAKGYFLQIEGSDEIYLIKNSTARALQLQLGDIRDRRLILFDKNQIAEMSIRNGARLKMVPFRRFDMFIPDSFDYMLEEPFRALVPVGSAELRSFLDSMPPVLNIVDFVDSGSPEDYGITSDSQGIRVLEKSGKEFQLFIGRQAGQTKVYGKLSGDRQIFTLSRKELPFLDLSGLDLADKRALLVDREKIDGITVTTGDLAIICDVERSNGRNIYLVNGMDADEDSFSAIFKSIQSIVIKETTDEVSGPDRPDIRISYKLKDGGSHWTHLNLHRTGEAYLIGRDEDDPLFTASAQNVEAMVNEVTAVADKIMGF